PTTRPRATPPTSSSEPTPRCWARQTSRAAQRRSSPTTSASETISTPRWTRPPYDGPVLGRFHNPARQPREHLAARRRPGAVDAACPPQGRGPGGRPFGFPNPADSPAPPNCVDDDGDRLR